MKPRIGSFQPQWTREVWRGGHLYVYGQSATGNWFNIQQHKDGSATIKWEIKNEAILEQLNSPAMYGAGPDENDLPIG